VPLGIYISVPFCRTKCSYCNFASDVFSRAVFERYVERVCADVESADRIAAEVNGTLERAVDSIYLGGGTPTVLEAGQLERIFGAVRRRFEVSPDAEVTVECAPGTLTPAVLETLQHCGVNRVSLGVQSFVDQEAAAVGRLHKRTTVLDDIARLRAAGITNINIDLIAGLPHQTRESWEFSLAETVATQVPHVSVYMLEVDEDSRLGRELIAGGARYHAHFVPDEESMADFYVSACEQLQAAGVAQYEISNFARAGFESRHNLKYWTRQPYLGFGVDAHSMLAADREEQDRDGHGFSRAAITRQQELGLSPGGGEIESVRFSTADTLEQFVAGAPVQHTVITRRSALEENFFLGLRLTKGVNLRNIVNEFGDAALADFDGAVVEFVQDGLLSRDGDCVRLTPRGRLLSNEVFQRFILPRPTAVT
jgi:oxygen-independent coproporphyrinogen-3 oxidase